MQCVSKMPLMNKCLLIFTFRESGMDAERDRGDTVQQSVLYS